MSSCILRGVQAFHFGKNEFELGIGGGARTRPDILKVFLGQYVQYCPCEVSEQKLGQKPESELKVIKLSYCHHSICLKKQAFLKSIRPKLAILSPKILQKIAKKAISQNPSDIHQKAYSYIFQRICLKVSESMYIM